MTRYFHEFLPLECYDPCDPWILREVERVHILRDQDSLFEHCQVCPLCGRTKPQSPVRSKPPPKPLPLPADRPWVAQSPLEHESLPPSPAMKEQSHNLNCNASGSAVIKLKSPPSDPRPSPPPSPRNTPFPVTPPRSKHSRPPSTTRSPSKTPKLTQQASRRTSPQQDHASSQYRPEPRTVLSRDLQHESVPPTRRPSSPTVPLNRSSRQNILQDSIPSRASPGKHLRASTSSGAQYKSLKSSSTRSPPISTLRSPGQMTPCASPLLQRCMGSRRSDPEMWRSNLTKFIQSLRPTEPLLTKNHPESSLCHSRKIPLTNKSSKTLQPPSRAKFLSADGPHPKERPRGQPDSASDPILFPRPPSPPPSSSSSSRRRPNQPPWPPQAAASGVHVNTDSNGETRISESQSTPAVTTTTWPPKSPKRCDPESSIGPLSQLRAEQLETKECKQHEAKDENGLSNNESIASDSSSLSVVHGTVETVEKTVEILKPSHKERGRRRGAAWQLAMAWRLPVVQGMAPADLEVAQEAQER